MPTGLDPGDKILQKPEPNKHLHVDKEECHDKGLHKHSNEAS